jgi:aryl-alcohol dehydrogenase-like predicted oxidoreductase
MLTGKMDRTSSFEADDHRQFNRQGAGFDRGETFSGLDYETGLQAVEELRRLVPDNMSLTQLALRWILMSPAVTCAIPGAKRSSQVEENSSAADLPALSEETMTKVREIYDRLVRPQVQHYW